MSEKPRSDPRQDGRQQVLRAAQAEAAAESVSLEAVLLLTVVEALAMVHAATAALVELELQRRSGPGIIRPRGLG